MDCEGTPIEKMMLMLNEKIDALHDVVNDLYSFVNSARHDIPWATNRSPDSSFRDVKPDNIQEWSRRGWDVWETLPNYPDMKPYYEITNRDMRKFRLNKNFNLHSVTRLLTE